MPDDLYASLIGEGAGSRGSVIADALRRRRMLGQLGVLTGDKVLAASGQDLNKSADEYAKQLQDIRQKDIDNTQTKAYQEGQLRYMDDNLAETIRNNNMDHEYQMLMARAALERANRPVGGGKIPKLRQGDIKELQDLGQVIGTVDSISKFLDDGGSFGAVTVGGVPVPGARAFKNYAASKGYGSPEDQASFLAKQNWERLYNIAERNRMFGTTLTNHEKASWDAANPSVGMTDKQIAAALPVMRKVFQHRLDKKVSGLMKEGYNPEAIADYADIPGINLPTAVGGDQTPSAAGATPKRIKVDAQGNIIGN